MGQLANGAILNTLAKGMAQGRQISANIRYVTHLAEVQLCTDRSPHRRGAGAIGMFITC